MPTQILKNKSGLHLCSKYAFMPNKLKYCGPSNERTLFDYAAKKVVDQGLIDLLAAFECLYPYMRLIARANRIRDPFDLRVVEAYWVGNSLLNNVLMNQLYVNLIDEHKISRRLSQRYAQEIIFKIPEGAKPHHSFQVLNVFINTGRKDFRKIIPTLESCLVLPGKVREIKGGFINPGGEFIKVDINGLNYKNGRLSFSRKQTLKARYKFYGQGFVDDLRVGDFVAVHWGFVCDKLSPSKAKRLTAWNQYHLNLANLTI